MSGLPGSVEEVLTYLGIEITSRSDRQLNARCPFHDDDHPSFTVQIHSGLWICYQCSRKGNLTGLLKALGGEDFSPKEFLREVKHGARHRHQEPEAEPTPLVAARYRRFKMPPDWALEERMISPRAARRYGLKWDRGWIIPIWAPEGEDDLWGWQFKRLDFVSNYPKSVKKSQTLFGLREIGKARSIVLVESPLDVVRLASVDVPAVAAYGAYVSQMQLQLLIHVAGEIVLALDNDETGSQQTDKLFRLLRHQKNTEVADFPKGRKDPGEMSDKEVIEVFK